MNINNPVNKKKKNKMTYRYYEIPPGSSVLGLFRESWSRDITLPDRDSLHFHNHLEIGYCYNGAGSLTFGEETIDYGGDMFTVVPKNFPHMTNSDKSLPFSWEYLIIDADGMLTEKYRENPHLAERLIHRVNRKVHLARTEEQPQIAFLIQQIFQAMKEQNELYQDEVNALILALLIRLAQWNRKENDTEPLPRMENSTILSPALDYISTLPEHSIKIEELARMCHISETHFRRLFVDCMKMSPVKYINQVRIRRACDELKRTDESMETIAIRAGFTTLSTFNRTETSGVSWGFLHSNGANTRNSMNGN